MRREEEEEEKRGEGGRTKKKKKKKRVVLPCFLLKGKKKRLPSRIRVIGPQNGHV